MKKLFILLLLAMFGFSSFAYQTPAQHPTTKTAQAKEEKKKLKKEKKKEKKAKKKAKKAAKKAAAGGEPKAPAKAKPEKH